MKWWGVGFAFVLLTGSAASAQAACVEVWSLWGDRFRHTVDAASGAVTTVEVVRSANRGQDSPDGRYNARLTAPRPGGARSRLMLTDRSRGISALLAKNVTSLAWSPDGVWLAYMQADDIRNPRGLALYNLQNGERAAASLPVNDWESLGIAWSPDSRWIAATFVVDRQTEFSDVLLFTVPDLAPRQRFMTRLSIATTRWSPDGRVIAGYGTNNEFALMHVASGDISGQKLHGRSHYQVDWSPGGSYVLVKYSIGELGQWMVILNTQGETVVDSTWITAHEWVNDGQALARLGTQSGVDDLALIDLESGEQRVIQPRVGLYALSADGRYVAAVDAAAMTIHDLSGQEAPWEMPAPPGVRSLVWQEDGREILALFEDRWLRAYDFQNWRAVAQIPGGETMLRRVGCG
jgi:WD40 repeat protein